MGNGLSALHQAAMEGDVSKLRVAVQEQPGRIDDAEPAHGWTALHIAAAKGFDILLRELAARGADLNAADKEGRTPLHLAAGAGQVQCLQDLLQRKADPTRRDAAGALPYDLAVKGGRAAAAALLR